MSRTRIGLGRGRGRGGLSGTVRAVTGSEVGACGRQWLAGMVVASVVIALAACGSSDREDAASLTSPSFVTATTTTRSAPQPAGSSRRADAPRLVGKATSTRCGANKVTGPLPPGGRVLPRGSAIEQGPVSIRIRSAFTVGSVRDVYRPDKATVRPAKGTEFVAVRYDVTNTSESGTAPRYFVNKPLILRSKGTYWRSAEWSRPCGSASAALALERRLGFTNAKVEPGRRASSLALFVVPSSSGLMVASSVTGDRVPARVR